MTNDLQTPEEAWAEAGGYEPLTRPRTRKATLNDGGAAGWEVLARMFSNPASPEPDPDDL